MGIAQQEQVRLLKLGLEVCPVHHPAAVLLHHLIFNDPPSGKFGHVVELAIHRRLNQHVAPLGGVELHAGAKGLNYPQAKAHQGRVRGPAVPAALPVPDGLEIAGGPGGVAPKTLLCPGLQGVDNGLSGLEIHVRNPEGNYILKAEFLEPFVVLGGEVSGPVDDLVKIVSHSLASFLK